MSKTNSAKKAVRQSIKKRAHNLFWKGRVRNATKSLKKSLAAKTPNADILKVSESALQKALDKATKNRVIHKNKANRLKSRYAKKIAAHTRAEKKTRSKGTTAKA